MQDVQPLGLFLGEESGDDGVDEGFHGAVGDGDEQGAQIKRIETGGLQSEDKGDEVANDSEDGDDFVADLIDDEAKKDDAKGERPHACAVDGALLSFGEVEGVLQFANGVGANAEDEGGGDEGDEAGPKELHVRGGGGRGFGGSAHGVLVRKGGLKRIAPQVASLFV